MSRNKGNQKIKFYLLIAYEKYFLEKSYTICVEETSLRPFKKNKIKLSIFPDQQAAMLKIFSLLYV